MSWERLQKSSTLKLEVAESYSETKEASLMSRKIYQEGRSTDS